MNTSDSTPAPVDESAATGRFAYEGLERVFHEKARLSIMTSLVTHPGGLLMAHAILTGLGAPAKVSDVVIDAGAKTATPEKCKVENLSVSPDTMSFDRTDEALPVPVQKDWLTLLPYVNDLKDLNYYGLTVKGLTKGIWGISIRGVEVRKASADEL